MGAFEHPVPGDKYYLAGFVARFFFWRCSKRSVAFTTLRSP